MNKYSWAKKRRCIAICNATVFNNFLYVSFSTNFHQLPFSIYYLVLFFIHHSTLQGTIYHSPFISITNSQKEVSSQYTTIIILYNEQVQKNYSRRRDFEIFIFVKWRWDNDDPNDDTSSIMNRNKQAFYGNDQHDQIWLQQLVFALFSGSLLDTRTDFPWSRREGRIWWLSENG